jgi:hypothetical protein
MFSSSINLYLGATTPNILTHGITTLSIMTLSITIY